MEDIEKVEDLTLGGRDTFGHDIDHDFFGVWGVREIVYSEVSYDILSVFSLQELYQSSFALLSDSDKLFDKLFVIFPSVKLLEKVQVNKPFLISQTVSDYLSQVRVCTLNPSALRDTVCYRDNFLRIHFIEITEN